MNQNQLHYLTKNTHEAYKSKEAIQKLVHYSYRGGQSYKDNEFLHKYTERETSESYKDRKKRSIYFNNVQPLADMMVGFLHTYDVSRSKIKNQEFMLDANNYDDFNSLMIKIATTSILTTTGILVDSPKFNDDDITEARRIELGLKPIVNLYEPWKIRNYYINKQGKLEWLILDNSYIKNDDPFSEQETIYSYRLWTQTTYQDFYSYNQSEWIESEEFVNPIGEIPFIFGNWTDIWNEHITDTTFEDIALFDQSIYNYMSLFDENMYAGTFKMLFWPGKIDEQVKTSSLRNMSTVSFDPTSSNVPFFSSPKLEDMSNFLSAIDFLIIGILRKLGLNTDHEKNYSQSGIAKSFDFKKVKAFLAAGASSMENIEKSILYYAGLWMNIDDSKAEIEYNKDFLGEEQEQEFMNLITAMASMPDELYKKEAQKRIAELTLKNIPEDTKKAIDESIDADEPEEQISNDDIQNLANEETEDENND